MLVPRRATLKIRLKVLHMLSLTSTFQRGCSNDKQRCSSSGCVTLSQSSRKLLDHQVSQVPFPSLLTIRYTPWNFVNAQTPINSSIFSYVHSVKIYVLVADTLVAKFVD